MQTGYFISFEGIDGSGKTTQARLLYKYLIAKGIKTVLTKEIGGTDFGDKIKNLILGTKPGSLSNSTEMFAIMAARNEHIDKLIQPKLQEGYVVICDRFVDSTAAYQSTESEDLESIYETHKIYFDIWPNLTFYLNISLANSKKNLETRLENRGDMNSLDKMPDDKKIALIKRYNQIAENYPERIMILDANKSIEQVHLNIVNSLDEIIKNIGAIEN